MDDVNKGVPGNEDCDDDNGGGTTVSKTINSNIVSCDSDDADMVDSANNTNENDNKTNGEYSDKNEETPDRKNTYASRVVHDKVPTESNEEVSKVVVFDEELVSEGSNRWNLTECGYFVGV
nr:hypothetical protein [Tanacetum cinerariifolium]